MTEQIVVKMNLTMLREQLASEDNQHSERSSVLVIDIYADGPAERAGIRGGFVLADINGTPVEIGGDVIVRIDEIIIPNVNALDEFIEKKDIGDSILVSAIRQGQPLEIPVTVG
jgi:serine protease Do